MVNVRRALGLHSERFGTVSAHGKGSHIGFDPGKEALTGILAGAADFARRTGYRAERDRHDVAHRQ